MCAFDWARARVGNNLRRTRFSRGKFSSTNNWWRIYHYRRNIDFTPNPPADVDVYLIKTDGNGNVTSEFTIPINPNRELEKVVDILGRDINPEKNKPFIEIYNDGTVEKKIIIE